MSAESSGATPEKLFQRYLWRQVIRRVCPPLEAFTTWTLTGVGATAALLLANLDSLDEMVSTRGIGIVLVVLAVSLVTGAVSKQIGMVLPISLDTSEQVEADLQSPSGREVMNAMTIEVTDLPAHLAEPFLWPLSKMIRSAVAAGASDFLAQDRRLMRTFCVQLWCFWAHAVFAIAALPIAAIFLR